MEMLSGVRAGWGQWVSRCYISAPAQRPRDSSLWDQGNTSNQYLRLLPSAGREEGKGKPTYTGWNVFLAVGFISPEICINTLNPSLPAPNPPPQN